MKEVNSGYVVDVKNGDVVRLKSGGPLMTVIENDPTQGIRCCWFSKDEEIKVQAFAAGILDLITE